TVQKGSGLEREEFLCEHLYEIPYIPKVEGIRTERYKYFRYLNTSVEELYDLKADPMEVKNLVESESHTEILAKLRKRTTELIAEAEK
ncbi:MAG: sulfatase/phosphatase domain-containing protein, partial [Bacteroidota bacterium]